MPDIISRKEAKALGLKRYFTGESCKHGHVCERLLKGCCVECRRLEYWKNRERNLARHAEWRSNNRMKCREVQKRWREANPELKRERSRRYQYENREKVNKYNEARRKKMRIAIAVLERLGIEL